MHPAEVAVKFKRGNAGGWERRIIIMVVKTSEIDKGTAPFRHFDWHKTLSDIVGNLLLHRLPEKRYIMSAAACADNFTQDNPSLYDSTARRRLYYQPSASFRDKFAVALPRRRRRLLERRFTFSRAALRVVV